MSGVLAEAYYQDQDVLSLSKSLLGKFLCTRIDGLYTSGIIVETEAYKAPHDKACHAYQNRRTPRTETMFMAGGICYIYLCYGIHHLFNIVTGAAGQAHAVLIRAIEPAEGVEAMLKRRNQDQVGPYLTAGPGRLTQALGLSITHNGYLLQPETGIWIEDRGSKPAPGTIISSPRVGVDYAEECASWDWRFRIKEHPWTSKPH